MMAVFRIEKTRDYTVMSNHHLRNAGLSLKSKGLLSMMLSLPEDWNYTTRGLAKIWQGRNGQHRFRPEGTGAGRVHSPQSAARQQGQDRGCGVCHLRDAPSPGHGPAV